MTKPSIAARIRTRLRRYADRLRRAGPMAQPAGFVFVVTYGRTGSTLLQKLLNTMPGVYVAGENFDIVHPLFEAWRNAGVLKEKYGWGHQASDHPWHGALAADPRVFGASLADAFVRDILKPPRGTRLAGFKEIRYLTDDLEAQLAFMAEVFAPARFVFNTRAVDAVAQSAWWKDVDKDDLTADIARFEAQAAAFSAMHPAQCVTVDYACWTVDAEALRPVYALLGAPFDAAAVANLLSVRLEHLRPKH
jgi:hypothetical protein